MGVAIGSESIGFNGLHEGRINFKNSPFDAGLQLSSGLFFGEVPAGFFAAITSMIYTDYNYRMKNVAAFGGLGAGYYVTYATDSFVFGPRIGVELFSHLRFTFDYKIINRDLSYGSVNIGVVFGGGRKK